MASVNYLSMADDTVSGNINFRTDTFKGMLVTSAYSPDVAAHMKRSDVTNEVTGDGYTAGGFPVTITVTKDTSNNRLALTFESATLPNTTVNARALVVYKARGGAASADELVSYLDFNKDVVSTNGPFEVGYQSPLYINV